MLTPLQATEYADHLHPAFAGYIYDGVVSETDALATIFYFIKKGYIEPEFTDNNITHGIAYLRQMAKQPVHLFERAIMAALFAGGSRVAATEVGTVIKNGLVQRAVEAAATNNPKLLVTPPEKLWASQRYESRHVVNDPDQVIHQVVNRPKISLLAYIAVASLFLFVIYRGGDMIEFGYVLFWAILVPFLYKRYVYSTRLVYHQNLPPHIKRYYDELWEFLSHHPVRPHTFTYEYIPYAIAFGLDKSWHKDFGLKPTNSVRHNPDLS